MRTIFRILITLSAIAIAYFAYKAYAKEEDEMSEKRVSAAIAEVKQMVRLNSFQANEEIIYKDTIDNLGVVYAIEVNIRIGFDIDNLHYDKRGDKLIIEMPKAKIEKYQVGHERLLDAYNTTVIGRIGNIGNDPTPNGTQSMILHGRISHYIDKIIEERGYEETARNIAMENLAKLFYAMQGDIVITDNLDTEKVLQKPTE